MRRYHGGRSQSQYSTGHPYRCIPEDCNRPLEYVHRRDSRPNYLFSLTNSCSVDHHSSSRNTGNPPECPGGPMSMPEPLSASCSTFPRMHHNPQQFDSCDECMAAAAAHPSGKINRLPPNLLDQFEKQLPLHHDGFHTLQYQRTSAAEQRSESPSRIRHLVHSVQKLFAKSHSLEAPMKREFNGNKQEARGSDGYHHQHHQSKHSKRSKSKDRKVSSKHRTKITGWWSSDDNLDSDSSFMISGRHAMDQSTQYCVDTPESAFRDLTLKSLKSGGEGKCLACAGMSLSLDGQTLKRSAWHSLTVRQAREAYPGSGNQDKVLMLQEAKAKDRGYHYLQVPQDEWGGYPASGKEGEIPCRRMRSGSYIKAMGDDDSGDSDTSIKISSKGASRRDGYRRSSSVDQPHTKFSCKRYSDSHICNCPSCCTPPKIHPRGPGYRHHLASGQIHDDLNHQFESVFGEMESQAVEALDLPGCFRMRSHSYLRAIQAGCSQDDDCISVFSMSAPPLPALPGSILKPSTSSSLPDQRSPVRSALSPPQRSGTLVTYSTTSVEGDTEDQEGEGRRCQGMIINPYLEPWSTKDDTRISLTVGRQTKFFRRISPGPLASSSEDPLCYLSAHTGWGEESDSDILPSDRVPESAESSQSGRDGGSQQTELASLPGGLMWPLLQDQRKEEEGDEDHQLERQLGSSQHSERSGNESLLSSEYPDCDQASGAAMPRRGGRPRAKEDRKTRWRASLHRLLQLEKLRDQLYRQELAMKEQEMTRQREERARDRELHCQLLGVLGDIRDELRRRRQERVSSQENPNLAPRGPQGGTGTSRRGRGGLTRPRGTRVSSVSATLPCSFAQFFLQDPRTGSSMPGTMGRGNADTPTWAGSRLIGPLRRRGHPRGRPRVHPKSVVGDTNS
uniref:Disks large-associated protein 3 isoform X2 n=1 Tax=Geotrypetes seraphini TaxID=260995 RepID=A0A6P8RV36_GEOSA|nr:disks large-associated protein 3 isoform X2 [Geotrypetes seraphini]